MIAWPHKASQIHCCTSPVVLSQARLKLIPGTIFVQVGSPDEDEVLLLCTPAALFSIGVWIACV